MKRYLVSVWTRQSYTQWVEAESEEEAKMIAEREWDRYGTESDDNEEIDESQVTDEEEIEDENVRVFHHDSICCKKLRPDSEVVSYEKT